MGESNCPVSISIALLFITFFYLMNGADNIGRHNNHHLICLETPNSKSFAAVHSAANGETIAAMWTKMTFMRWCRAALVEWSQGRNSQLKSLYFIFKWFCYSQEVALCYTRFYFVIWVSLLTESAIFVCDSNFSNISRVSLLQFCSPTTYMKADWLTMQLF